MKAKELIAALKENLEPNAELDFLCLNFEKISDAQFWLDVLSINMNADVDDPKNKHRGGIVFRPRRFE